ncbi:hypothetical protein [Vibrio rumoiensis]|uniref:Tail fiber assembly protein n=1 Tax=Vibrio rumoiensis TaxID=76258 RepID=A0ABW7J0M3_9VIBR
MKLAQYHFETGEYLRTVDAVKNIKSKEFMIPPYHTPDLPIAELEDNEYHVFLDNNGNVPRDYANGAWAVKTRFVKVTAYNKQTKQPKEFEDKTLVDDEYTLLEPQSFQKWGDEQWVQNDEAVAAYNAQNGKVIRDNAVSDDLTALDVEWDVLNDAADIRRVINDAETIDAQETDTTQFRLADNTWRETSLAELRQVLCVFIARKRDIWNQFAQWDATDKLEAFSPEY